MPEYVEYGSLATVAGPLRCLHTREWGFLLEADPERLDALCRRVFAEPSGGKVNLRPIGRHVAIAWGAIGEIRSETRPFDAMGAAPETQVAIWIPVADVRGDVIERVLLFMPYIWLENPISLPSGREMYGFPKAWGWPGLPETGEHFDALTLDVYGMDFGSGAAPTRHPLLEIRPGAPHGEPREGLWSHLHHIAAELARLAHPSLRPGLAVAEQLAGELRRGELTQVLLKQVRAIEDGRRAALQQITEIPYRVSELRGAPLLHECELTVHALDSHPLAADLGLSSQTTRIGWHVEMDFTLEAGRVIWEATG